MNYEGEMPNAAQMGMEEMGLEQQAMDSVFGGLSEFADNLIMQQYTQDPIDQNMASIENLPDEEVNKGESMDGTGSDMLSEDDMMLLAGQYGV